ncbi:hypothetical protein [Saccharothrix algeriensis]|uniref:Uncharacterized protein n=1 Tax=Saccharothrix algeriensis TaxID=173560 RepID=A0A8T8I3G8_9PSEU|nr:hypothetical protein [Saccharothrix algeriensis]MBM7811398.1 hypothetical protein [Saccharothrix algeriensis]QTR05267.1 hypothetical protein J7S33_11660 [Saccharothrix algeriensis]
MRWLALVVAVIPLAGCGAGTELSAAPELTIEGRSIVDPQGLQMRAEAELSYTLNFGYVARAGREDVNCWFARTGAKSEVDTRLWCGPVQVPGTAAATDWVPVPLKEVERGDGGVRLEVQPPQVPELGTRSTPVGRLVRTDGRETEADQGVGEAGPDFLAVLPDDGRPLDGATGMIRDDQLSARITGYGTPESWRTEQGELRAEHGVRLRVLRLAVERLTETDSAFRQTPWAGWRPQPPELALQVPGRRHRLPIERLPENGSVFVVYTVPESGGGEELVLHTVGAKSLEQRVEVPSGRPLADAPAVLRRPGGPAEPAPVEHRLRVGGQDGALEVQQVRLGRQRPVSAGAQFSLATASAPDRALLELRLLGKGLPQTAAGPITQHLVAVTLPDGSRAPLVGARHGGDTFPVALVVEVPADVRSVDVSVTSGSVALPVLGGTAVEAGPPVTVPLDF